MPQHRLASVLAAVLVLVVAFPLVTAARAQSVADFYRGKTIDLNIGYSVGGGYDLYARLIARRLGAHIPGNPTVVPKNMEGAGSLRLANYLYSAAPNDGTVIGAVSRGAAFDPLLNEKGARFDASKFSWIGSANNEVSVCVALASSGVTKFDDLFTNQLTIGSTGAADDTYQFPALINAVLGTKFKIVTGYPGGNDVSLALERGEVQGRCGWSWSSIKTTRVNWVRELSCALPASWTARGASSTSTSPDGGTASISRSTFAGSPRSRSPSSASSPVSRTARPRRTARSPSARVARARHGRWER